MKAWIANGARLGWLIDPYRKTVDVYAAGLHEVVHGASIAGSGPVEGFVLDLSEVWRCYEY
jgi:Uma2 family endonuclease